LSRLFGIRPVNFESATGPGVAKRVITFMKRTGRKYYSTAVCMSAGLKVKKEKRCKKEGLISKNLLYQNFKELG